MTPKSLRKAEEELEKRQLKDNGSNIEMRISDEPYYQVYRNF